MRVTRIDEKLKALSKPGVESISVLPLESSDALIFCAGFEERANEVLKKLCEAKKRISQILIVQYVPENKNNMASEAIHLCSELGINAEVFIYDRENPQGFGGKTVSFFENFSGRIYIDISGMSRLLIVQLLVEMKKRPNSLNQVSLLYTEAKTYPPTKEEAEEALRNREQNPHELMLLISAGVLDICVVPELSSTSMNGQPSRLVAFPSFNPDQLNALRSSIQPSYLTYIHGIPPDDSLKWRPEIIRKLNLLESSPLLEEFDSSTLDYRGTLDVLLTIYQNHGVIEKIIVAPTGSKMQAVAVGIFKSFFSDIQIVFPASNQFASPEKYTQGVNAMYRLPLDLFSSI